MPFKQDEFIKGLIISGVGAYAIYQSYLLPCNITPNPAIGLTQEIAKITCYASNPLAIIISIAGAALLFAGITKMVQNI